MRYNTVDKRSKVKTQVREYIIKFALYTPKNADKLVNTWTESGARFIYGEQAEIIRLALLHIQSSKDI